MSAFRRALAGMAVCVAGTAHAQPAIVADSGDNGWMLAASMLILAASLPGLALFYAGARGTRTALALFGSTAIVTLLFVAIGYTLAFGEGTAWIGGFDNMMLSGLSDVQPDMTISATVYALFELAVAIFAAAILVSSLAGRTRLGWLFAFAALWSLLVYVPLARSIWGGGWLAELGTLDYAGGIVVQTSVGVSALIVAILMGRDRSPPVVDDAGMAASGVSLLWVGSLALIGASSFGATDDAAEAILNAQLAASSATIVGLLIERLRSGATTVGWAATSAIAGLAAISAGAGYVGPEGAILLGAIGAVGAVGAAWLVRVLNLGIASRAFVAHGGGAILGAILFPIFILPIFGGPGFDDGLTLASQMATQGLAVLAAIIWAAFGTTIAALMIAMVLPMAEDERAG